MVQSNIETLLHIQLEGNAATIVTLSVVFGITMFLLVVSVAAYFVYNCKVTKPKEKKKWNAMVSHQNLGHMEMGPIQQGTLYNHAMYNHGAQGMGAQGMGAQGMGPQGMGPHGMGAQSMGPQGMGPQGMGPQAAMYQAGMQKVTNVLKFIFSSSSLFR